jgi:hypothetical protein
VFGDMWVGRSASRYSAGTCATSFRGVRGQPPYPVALPLCRPASVGPLTGHALRSFPFAPQRQLPSRRSRPGRGRDLVTEYVASPSAPATKNDVRKFPIQSPPPSRAGVVSVGAWGVENEGRGARNFRH